MGIISKYKQKKELCTLLKKAKDLIINNLTTNDPEKIEEIVNDLSKFFPQSEAEWDNLNEDLKNSF